MPADPACRACPLGAQAVSPCVWGDYSDVVDPGTPYDVLVVGEAPGPDEDVAGRPFVGPAGDLLKRTLAKAGIREYYATYAVKCRPPAAPKAWAIKACKGYLHEELAAVRPRYILALGNTAWHQFGQGPITEHAGRETYREDLAAYVMPVLSPSAVLRDAGRQGAWELDVLRFGRLVRGELTRDDKPPVQVKLIRTPEQLRKFADALRGARQFSYDFEWIPGGKGKVVPWWDKAWVPYTVAFSFTGREAVVVPLRHPESPLSETDLFSFFSAIKDVATDPGVAKIAHNMLADDLAWYRCAGYLPACTFDTMLAAQLLDENRPKSLKYLGRAVLGWPNWDIDASREHPLAHLSEYNGYDAAASVLLRGAFREDLRREPALLSYFGHLEMPKVRALERVIVRGVHLDVTTLGVQLAAAWERYRLTRAAVPVENPDSTRQVAAWLYGPKEAGGLALPVIKKTPDGVPSTDEETIKTLALDHPDVRVILPYRKEVKHIRTYLKPPAHMRERSYDRRLHYEYRTTSVETGRLASAFHTVPRDRRIRSIYSAPPGCALVAPDFSQIEARLAAWKALGCPPSMDGVPDRSMLAAWYHGRDVYVETAAEALGKRPEEVTRDKDDPENERQVMGKVPTLAMLYRISPNGLRTYAWRKFEIVWTPAQAEAIHAAFYRRWPEFLRWHEREERLLRERGYAVSPIGRVRRLPGASQPDTGRQAYKQIHEAINAGINAPIQSVASDITQAAMVLLDRAGFRIVGNIHDSLLFEVPEGELDEAVPVIVETMRSAHRALRPLGLYLPDGLIDVDVQVGPWGAGKSWKPVARSVGASA